MTHFEREFFQKFKFTKKQIQQYFQNAVRDLEIARTDPYPEVRFNYCYQALIKAGIALFAKKGQVRVRSIPGHHVKILMKTSELLNDSDVLTIGNAMRMKRNLDFYGGGQPVTRKEVEDYLRFVEKVIVKVKGIIGGNVRLSRS